jgi:DNA-binding response OmpR family regulator/Flp pilus assembly protein TadD
MSVQGSQFTLLLVDDNPTNLTLLAKIIELDLPEVQVLTASNGQHGLQLAEREQIDGAFIDVQMPEMSGLEMCRQLKANPRTADMPLVLITAHLASPEMRAEGLEVGAYDFISQPISNVEMLARIKVMLRLCEGERTRFVDRGQSSDVQAEHAAQLRWLNGLFLSGDAATCEPDQALLQQLAMALPASAELDDQLLLELWLERFPAPWRKTLLKLALLKELPLALAVKLSEIEDIEAVCDYLQRHNLLLEPLAGEREQIKFKASLTRWLEKAVAKQLPQQEQHQLCQQVADWYQLRNRPVEAFACLLRAGNYPAISQLLSHYGLALLADQYQPEFMQLLAQVPEEEAVGCGWLALYTGVSCLRSQPLDADTWLELARNRFLANADQRGQLLAVSQQVLQYVVADGQVELGPARLKWLRELAEPQLELLAPINRLKVQFSLAFGALFYAGELERCEQILSASMAEAVREKLPEQQMNLALLQVMLAVFQGRYRVARTAMEQAAGLARQLSSASYPVAVFQLVACELLYSCGELDSFARQRHLLRQVWGSDGLAQSSFAPLANFFSAMTDIAKGQFSAAEELLEVTLVENPAAQRPHLRSWLLQLRGFLLARSGNRESAFTDSAQALELRQQAPLDLHRLPNLLLAGATAALVEDYAAAEEHLRAGLALSEQLAEGRHRGGFHAWLAALYIDQQQDQAAFSQLELLFELLRKQRVDFFFALTPDLLRKLVPLAASNPDWNEALQRLSSQWLDSEVNSAGRLVQQAHLQTLGAFKFSLAGRVCDLSEVGQSSRLLMALLASAPNCNMSSEMIMGTLWPESPPIKARNSFDTALSRLRKALEGPFGKQVRQDYLLLEKGMLLLRNLQIDSQLYWQTIERVRLQLQRQNRWQAELLFWQAERLWQGEFLAGFELEADLPYRRDQFNQLRLEQLAGLAELLIRRGELSEAVRLLQLGLQGEPTNDMLVQQLLEIYQQQGEKRAARQLLDNYRGALQDEDYDVEEIDELITSLGPQRFEA